MCALMRSILSYFSAVFAGLDLLVQCMSTTTHWHPNHIFYWSNEAHSASDAFSDNYQSCFYRVSNPRTGVPKLESITLRQMQG